MWFCYISFGLKSARVWTFDFKGMDGVKHLVLRVKDVARPHLDGERAHLFLKIDVAETHPQTTDSEG